MLLSYCGHEFVMGSWMLDPMHLDVVNMTSTLGSILSGLSLSRSTVSESGAL